MNAAMTKLRNAQRDTSSLLCVGLEPSPEYLHRSFAPNLQGYEEFLRLIIEATEGLVCAYKINLAFFESLGWEGIELLYAVRESVPDDVLLVADGKRGDIGSTGKHYAMAIYDQLEADATTINPLMGLDAAEPFLSYGNKLNFFLCLTSNPGAADFLMPGRLYAHIAERVVQWDKAGNCGLVVGATHPDQLTEIRTLAPRLPFLIPGIGAQGGALEATVCGCAIPTGDTPAALLHVTRGILPAHAEEGDPADIIRAKTTAWVERIRRAQESTTP